MKRIFALQILLIFSLSLLSMGCATYATRSSRHGLFDHVDAEAKQAKHEREDRAPASAEVHEAQTLFRWPLTAVRVTSPFGHRGRQYHEGVDLHASKGTPVYAAGDGKVLYAGARIRGYGQLVVIRHSNGWATVYGHNSRIFVISGQKVSQGQRIALTGSTGHSTGPHLHFEIRKGVDAIDPTRLIPRERTRG